jgi:hypothetical protein
MALRRFHGSCQYRGDDARGFHTSAPGRRMSRAIDRCDSENRKAHGQRQWLSGQGLVPVRNLPRLHPAPRSSAVPELRLPLSQLAVYGLPLTSFRRPLRRADQQRSTKHLRQQHAQNSDSAAQEVIYMQMFSEPANRDDGCRDR